jgi:hypothetical protein
MAHVSRSEWGALPPKRRHALSVPVEVAVVHHSVTPLKAEPFHTVRQIQRGHLNHPVWDYADIAYSELVAAAGTTFDGRGTGYVNGATQGMGSSSLAYCMLMDATKDDPPLAMLEALVGRLVVAVQAGRLSPSFRLIGHNDAPGNLTQCPGRMKDHLVAVRNKVAAVLSGAATVEVSDVIPEVQMTQLKQHMEHVSLVVARKNTETAIAAAAAQIETNVLKAVVAALGQVQTGGTEVAVIAAGVADELAKRLQS